VSSSRAPSEAVRDRFLSEIALALVEGGDLEVLLDRCVRELCRLLDADRVALFLRKGGDDDEPFEVRATHSLPGVEELPAELRVRRLHQVIPSLSAGQVLEAPDASAHPELQAEREGIHRLGTRSLMLAPITIDGCLRGIVSVSCVLRPRSWDPADAAFLESAGRHLAAAVKQMELAAALARERDRLHALFDLSSAMHRSGSSDDVVEAAMAGLRETLAFPSGAFLLISEDRGELIAVSAYAPGAPAGPLLRIALRAGSALEGALHTGEPLVVELPEAEAELQDACRALASERLAVLPLRAGSRALGALLVGAQRPLEPEDVGTLRSFAGLLGVAWRQRRNAESAQRGMREARALSEASRSLLTRTASRDVLHRQIMAALVQEFVTDYCSLHVVDAERRQIVEAGRHGDWSPSCGRALRLDGPGLIAWAVRSARAVVVPDVRNDERYLPGWTDAVSEMVVPIILDGEVLGVFDVQSARVAAFGAEDVRLLTAFAERTGLALRLSEVVAQLEERTRVLEGVARATQLLNFRLNAPDLLASFVNETLRAFPSAEGCVAYVADATGQHLTVAAASGLGRATLACEGGEPRDVGNLRCAGVAFRENRPVLVEVEGMDALMLGRTPEVRAKARAVSGSLEIRQLLAVPIRVGERRLGAIEVIASRPMAFSKTDVEMLSLLAEQAAIALRNARLIDELQRASKLKDDFLANLSHEVRTPLTGIVGWTEVLLDREETDESTRRALEAIRGQAESLSRLLSDLIDLSRLDSFGMEMRQSEVRLPEVIAAAVETVGPGAGKRGVSLRCDAASDLPPLVGDPARLKQVVWNLLANAVKFSSPGQEVRVAARRTEEGDAELVVEDQGHGIEPAFLPHVFDRFRQEETSGNRSFGGLGVGLSIAMAIVRAHGGSISAESEGRGRGSRFVVLLPTRAQAAPPARKAAHAAR